MTKLWRGITGFILRRVLLGLLTLFFVSLIVFAATQALPSDPARAILGRTATPESLKALREQLHLNHSVVGQYTHWFGGMLTGDLGNSLAARRAGHDGAREAARELGCPRTTRRRDQHPALDPARCHLGASARRPARPRDVARPPRAG